MAEYRPIKTKIWQDAWFRGLSPEEKVVWLFILTNDLVHISGIYELPLELIGVFTGVENYQIIVDKFVDNGKIEYRDGYIFLKNYLKHQTKQIKAQDNITKSIINYLKDNPKLAIIFNLKKQAPYKPLVSPLGKEESIKEESIKSAAPKNYQKKMVDNSRRGTRINRGFQSVGEIAKDKTNLW